MNGKVGDHPFGNKLFLAVVPYHLWVLLWWNFFGQNQHEAPGQLGVPLLFGVLYRVPEGFPVSVFRRSVSRQHDFGVQDAALARVVFGFLVVLRKQLLTTLVGCTCHRRLPLVMKHAGTYRRLKPLYDRYRHSRDKEKFLRGHESGIIIFEAAARELKKLGAVPLPAAESMEKELSELTTKKDMLLAGYKAARSEAQEYETIRQNVDALLSAPEAQKQQRRHELE